MSENYFADPRDHVDTVTMSLALDGLLEPEERLQFDQHVLACASCAARWSIWQRLDTVLRNEPLIGPAPGFIARVDRRLIERQKRRERWLGGLVLVGGTMSIWAVLAAGAVLYLIGWLWLNPGARLQVLELLGFGGQFLSVLVNTLYAWRTSLLTSIPGPLLVAFGGALLMAMALVWLRFIPPSHSQTLTGASAGNLNVGYTSVDRN